MSESEASPREKRPWVGRYLAYLALVIGVPWLAAEVAFRDCRGDQQGRGDDGLCGLAYVAVVPLAVAVMLVVLLGVEIVVRARRR